MFLAHIWIIRTTCRLAYWWPAYQTVSRSLTNNKAIVLGRGGGEWESNWTKICTVIEMPRPSCSSLTSFTARICPTPLFFRKLLWSWCGGDGKCFWLPLPLQHMRLLKLCQCFGCKKSTSPPLSCTQIKYRLMSLKTIWGEVINVRLNQIF